MSKSSRKLHLPEGPPAPEAAANISYGSLPNKIGFHLRMCQEASFRAFAARAGEPDMKPQRYTILTLIGENPGITQTLLSRCSGRDKSTLTPALNDLQARGLLERRRVESDRRSFQLYLTPEGEALRARLDQHSDAHDRDLDTIVGADKTALIRLLRRITTSLAQPDI